MRPAQGSRLLPAVTAPDSALRDILRTARTIAVVGLSPNPARPSHAVAAYLQQVGYRIIPVRPGVAQVLGEPAYANLQAARAAAAIEVVNVFRRASALADLADDLSAVRPQLVWMQVGVQDDAVAERLEREGILVVMDRCLMVEHSCLVGS